jgi:pentatricopeptide repeat protein
MAALLNAPTQPLESGIVARPLAAGRVAERIQDDPLARACCNALLRAYAAAQPPKSARALTLITCMSQCGPNNVLALQRRMYFGLQLAYRAMPLATRATACQGAATMMCSICRAAGHMRPDIVSYNSLFAAFAAVGQLDHAFALLNGIEQYGPVPMRATYDALLTAAGAAEQWEFVLRAHAGMLRAGALPDAGHLDTAIKALSMTVRFTTLFASLVLLLRFVTLERMSS